MNQKNKSRILVLDDSDSGRYRKVHALRQVGYEVVEVTTGRAAVAAMEQEQADLVVLNLQHRGVDAFEVCRRLKRKFPDTPLLHISATFTDSVDRVKALEAGANASLIAPFEPQELLAQTAALLRIRHAEHKRDLRNRLLELINQTTTIQDLASSMLALFQKETGCDAVALRLKKGRDYPYYKARGFPNEFLWVEGSLCVRNTAGNIVCDQAGEPLLECLCGCVIRGQTDPSKPFFTEGGSFWTNNATEFMATAGDYGLQIKTRGYCKAMGYESLALLPLRAGKQRLGLLHFADRAKGKFTLQRVQLLEEMTDKLGLALAKTRAEEELRATEERLRVFAEATFEGIVITEQGVIVEANEQFARMYGYQLSEVFGKLATHFLDESDHQRVLAIIMSNEVRRGEYTGLKKDGTRFIIEAQGREIEYGGRRARLTAIRDITERKRSEEQLRESRERLGWVLERSRIGLWLNELPLKKLNWDQQTRQLFFVPIGEEPTIELFWNRLHPDDRERTRAAIQQALRERSFYDVEHRAVHPVTAEVRWIRSMGQARYGPDGKPTHFDGLNYDITDRKRMEQQLRDRERLYRAIGESINYGIWGCAPDGRNIYASESFLKLVGLTQEQCSNFGWGSVLHPDDAEHTLAAWKECVARGGTWDMEHRYRGIDGQYHAVLARGLPVKNEQGEVICWAGINLDISRLKKTEEALRQAKEALALANESLEQTVLERTARLQETVVELENFSYAITHDMRSPLRAMRSFANMVREECADKVGPVGIEYLQRIETAAARMDSLITDALQFSNVVRTEYPLSNVDVEGLLRGMLGSYPNLQEPHADVQLEGTWSWVVGNQAGLTQCLSNLLENAVKFVAPGTKPRVRVRAEEAIKGKLRIWVEDNGIGVPKELQDRIWGMFQQLSRKYEGTGIGLALVKKACQRMGGEWGLQSEPGKGSRFWIELPMST